MRVCSLVPAATDMILALGLRRNLVGVTYECNVRGKPIVVTCSIDADKTSSAEIDRHVRENRDTLYGIDSARLAKLKPDVILAQGLCDVCAVTPKALGHANSPVVHLSAMKLAGVLKDILRVARATGTLERGKELVSRLRKRIERVRSTTRRLPRRRVACIEWLDPIFTSGHWVPEMVGIAGGKDLLARAGRPARVVSWQAVARTCPEAVIFMPCGFGIERTLRELDIDKWKGLCSNLFVVDAARYFNKPGPGLVDGIELLAGILYPEHFPMRRGARRL